MKLPFWTTSEMNTKKLLIFSNPSCSCRLKIKDPNLVDDHRSGKIVAELNGRWNKCGVTSPGFNIGAKEIERWTAKLLLSRQFGYIVLTTSAGIMDHEEAQRKNVGGKVLGFFY